ncbi:hypothetical protein BJG92_02752 [Arthrobacter sp. SO5]|uniref:DUF4192 family protein n=1 Tax=Arthrobacter sp. SO5 TaxID=1897055 RepID=UPI001E2D52B0|nr:DUF4192 family protein [Arthrobacter sp. SO5]MCB5275204.1 hypothetical protein [Arthrobacter sp. SO5]
MTAPDHLRITGPEDILGFIPHSLGYWPARSLVAMTLQGKRLGATLRVDLPDDGDGGGGVGGPGGSRGVVRFARSVASYLESDEEADGSLLAFFTGIDGDRAAWAGLLGELELVLSEAGMPVRDAWLIGAEYWCNAYCSDPSCCAPPGRPVEEIRNSRLNAEMVFRGSTVGAAPGAGAPQQPRLPEDPEVLASELAWAQWFAGRWLERQLFDQVLDVWGQVMHAAPVQELPADLSGYLRAALCVPAWRDAVLVMAAAGAEAARRGAEEFGLFDGGSAPPHGATGAGKGLRKPALPPPPLPTLPLPTTEGDPDQPLPAGSGGVGAGDVPADAPGYGEVLLGLAPAVPDWQRMGRLEHILIQLGEAGGEAAAAALTGRGWIEWCRGKGSYADALFSQAGEHCPGYRLAELLAELVRRGTLCGWAGRRDAAWQKFEPEAA